jgi:hypothetical protein
MVNAIFGLFVKIKIGLLETNIVKNRAKSSFQGKPHKFRPLLNSSIKKLSLINS